MPDADDYPRFVLSAPSLRHCPPDFGCEIAFAGRSNAGKSSVINALAGIDRIARTSKTPGRTQQLNFFAVAEDHRLVDLPGYGYAKAARALRSRWELALGQYLEQRRSLRGVVLVMDIRHPLKDSDWRMLATAQARALPVCALFNKADKLSKGQASQTLRAVTATLRAQRESVCPIAFSAKRAQGVAALRDWTRQCCQNARGATP